MARREARPRAERERVPRPLRRECPDIVRVTPSGRRSTPSLPPSPAPGRPTSPPYGGSSRPWPTCCAPASRGRIFRPGSASPGTVYRRFRRWACKGIWDELFLEGLPADALETTVMLDSTACKAQRFASGARGGGKAAPSRSRGGPTTRIHAVVDGLGRPLFFPLTPGQAADCRQARSLPEGLAFERLIGDHGGARPPASEAGPGGHRRGPRPGRGARRRSGDPVEAQPESADPARSPSPQGPPQGREPVLPDQGLHTRHPAQVRDLAQLRRLRQPRFRPHQHPTVSVDPRSVGITPTCAPAWR